MGFFVLLAALGALGVAFNKFVLSRPYVDSLANEWILDRRERLLEVPVLSAFVWPRSEAAYLRWYSALFSVVCGAIAAAVLGSVVALAWRALGMG